MRKETGDEKFVTEVDLDLRPLSERLRVFLLRPFQLLFQELIVFFISLYMSVLYGLLYMFFIVSHQQKRCEGSSTDMVPGIPDRLSGRKRLLGVHHRLDVHPSCSRCHHERRMLTLGQQALPQASRTIQWQATG